MDSRRPAGLLPGPGGSLADSNGGSKMAVSGSEYRKVPSMGARLEDAARATGWANEAAGAIGSSGASSGASTGATKAGSAQK